MKKHKARVVDAVDRDIYDVGRHISSLGDVLGLDEEGAYILVFSSGEREVFWEEELVRCAP